MHHVEVQAEEISQLRIQLQAAHQRVQRLELALGTLRGLTFFNRRELRWEIYPQDLEFVDPPWLRDMLKQALMERK